MLKKLWFVVNEVYTPIMLRIHKMLPKHLFLKIKKPEKYCKYIEGPNVLLGLIHDVPTRGSLIRDVPYNVPIEMHEDMMQRGLV